MNAIKAFSILLLFFLWKKNNELVPEVQCCIYFFQYIVQFKLSNLVMPVCNCFKTS